MAGLNIIVEHDRGPGYALLEFDRDLDLETLEIAVLNMFRDEYLGPSDPSKTNWLKEPYYFVAQRAEGDGSAFRIGPDICDYISPETIIEISSRDGLIGGDAIPWEGTTLSTPRE